MTLKEAYQPGEFSWVDYVAHDMEAAKSFYAALFGWEAHDQDTQGGPPYAMFSKDGRVVAGIGQMSDEMIGGGVPPLWNSYVSVRDAKAVEDKAAALGGKVLVPSMRVLDAGTLAFITDPAGASFGVWQADQHHGAQLVNAPGAFCWNELASPDVEASRSFYGELFGWSFQEGPAGPTKVLMIKNGDRDNGHMLQMTGAWEGVPPNWGVYFAVEDADRAAEKVAGLGGKVLVPPMDIPPGRFCVVMDAQGAHMNLIRLKELPE